MEIGHHRVKLLSNSRSIRGFVEVVETTIFLICIHQYLKEGPNVRGGEGRGAGDSQRTITPFLLVITGRGKLSSNRAVRDGRQWRHL